MMNFNELQELNLSNNWFGTEGLFQIKDEFLKFKKLKALSIATSKLCLCHQDDMQRANLLANVLLSFPGLEKLDLNENSMNHKKFAIVCQSIAQMKSLKHLNLGKNVIGYEGFTTYMKELRKVCGTKPSTLESLVLNGCYFKNEGVVALLEVLMKENLLENVTSITLNANEIEDLSLPFFEVFIKNYRSTKPLKIEMKKQKMFSKTLTGFRKKIQACLAQSRDQQQLMIVI